MATYIPLKAAKELARHVKAEALARGREEGRAEAERYLAWAVRLNGHGPAVLKALREEGDERLADRIGGGDGEHPAPDPVRVGGDGGAVDDADEDTLNDALTLAAIDALIEAKTHGADTGPMYDYLASLLDDPDQLEELVQFKAFDEEKHPRGDDGRFIGREAIHEAKSNPELAEKLREKTTDPEERKKLEAALAGESDLGRTKAGLHRERVATAKKEKAERISRVRELANDMSMARRGGEPVSPEQYRELMQHLPALSIKELRSVREKLAASFWSRTKREDMVTALVHHAKTKAEQMEYDARHANDDPLDFGMLGDEHGHRPTDRRGEDFNPWHKTDKLEGSYTEAQHGGRMEQRHMLDREHGIKDTVAYNERGADVKPEWRDEAGKTVDTITPTLAKRDEPPGSGGAVAQPEPSPRPPKTAAKLNVPSNPSKLTIDQAEQALADLGYTDIRRVGGDTGHPDDIGVTLVRTPDGEEKELRPMDVRRAIYGESAVPVAAKMDAQSLSHAFTQTGRGKLLGAAKMGDKGKVVSWRVSNPDGGPEQILTDDEVRQAVIDAGLARGKPLTNNPSTPTAQPDPSPQLSPADKIKADEAELAALNRTPFKQLTKEQRARRDQLSREWSARKNPDATPFMTGGGKGPGVSDSENESTATQPANERPMGGTSPADSPPIANSSESPNSSILIQEMTAADALMGKRSFAEWQDAMLQAAYDDDGKVIDQSKADALKNVNMGQYLKNQEIAGRHVMADRKPGVVVGFTPDLSHAIVEHSDGTRGTYYANGLDSLSGHIKSELSKGKHAHLRPEAVEAFAKIVAKQSVEENKNISDVLREKGIDPIKANSIRGAIAAESEKLRVATKPEPSPERKRAMARSRELEESIQSDVEQDKEDASGEKYKQSSNVAKSNQDYTSSAPIAPDVAKELIKSRTHHNRRTDTKGKPIGRHVVYRDDKGKPIAVPADSYMGKQLLEGKTRFQVEGEYDFDEAGKPVRVTNLPKSQENVSSTVDKEVGKADTTPVEPQLAAPKQESKMAPQQKVDAFISGPHGKYFPASYSKYVANATDPTKAFGETLNAAIERADAAGDTAAMDDIRSAAAEIGHTLNLTPRQAKIAAKNIQDAGGVSEIGRNGKVYVVLKDSRSGNVVTVPVTSDNPQDAIAAIKAANVEMKKRKKETASRIAGERSE